MFVLKHIIRKCYTSKFGSESDRRFLSVTGKLIACGQRIQPKNSTKNEGERVNTGAQSKLFMLNC